MSDAELHIEINGERLPARKGQMIIQVADGAGITVPRFCYHAKLRVAANCRMCLVEVEKMPKPVPACATPVMDGMKVHTRSVRALDAQRSVMEFLLINHPLDCPICDEGGECDLQDTALGFGVPVSQYTEAKRVVSDPDLGPLIATEMTRCIHCTRCVRFGEEIAGIKELGATGRGEQMRIGTYVARAVESEISGNVIDLCPVGALTSKPFRFTARSWEVQKFASVSPHDCVGSNLQLHVVHGAVKRAVPRENEAVNEIWLSDRDRFAYSGLNSPERLTRPMVRTGDTWAEVDWPQALAAAVDGLRAVRDARGPQQLGALLAPTLSLEELYLGQKLVRGLGSENVDHRLREQDFSGDRFAPVLPAPVDIAGLERVDVLLLIGSELRSAQPLLNTRVRKAVVTGGAAVYTVDTLHGDFNYPLAGAIVGSTAELFEHLKDIAAQLLGEAIPASWRAHLAGRAPGEAAQRTAQALKGAARGQVLLGDLARMAPGFGALRALAALIAQASGANFGELTPGGNGAGAWLAGAVPHRGPAGQPVARPGLDARAMLEQSLAGYIVMDAEPELDCADSAAAYAALSQAQCVVMLTSFVTDAMRNYAKVLLPLAPYSESAGIRVNCAGTWQSANAALKPAGEARPGWKILRVLGELLDVDGFAHNDLTEVRRELENALTAPQPAIPEVLPQELVWTGAASGIQRLGGVPPYAVDPVVRRSVPLQQRANAVAAAVHLAPAQAQALGLADGQAVTVTQGSARVRLPLRVDARVPQGAAWVPSGVPATVGLGSAFGALYLDAGDP